MRRAFGRRRGDTRRMRRAAGRRGAGRHRAALSRHVGRLRGNRFENSAPQGCCAAARTGIRNRECRLYDPDAAAQLRPHIDAMRAAMAGAMGVGDDRVSVKATTTEHLGFAKGARRGFRLGRGIVDLQS